MAFFGKMKNINHLRNNFNIHRMLMGKYVNDLVKLNHTSTHHKVAAQLQSDVINKGKDPFQLFLQLEYLGVYTHCTCMYEWRLFSFKNNCLFYYYCQLEKVKIKKFNFLTYII